MTSCTVVVELPVQQNLGSYPTGSREACSVYALKSAQSCPTLCDALDCSPPGFSVYEILQAGILEWVAIPFSREFSRPREWTQVSCIADRFFSIWTTREACYIIFPCLSLHLATDRWGFPSGSNSKASVCNAEDLGSIPGLGRSPGEGKWQSTPVFLPGKFHGPRSLVGYRPWGRKEWDTTERLHFHFHYGQMTTECINSLGPLVKKQMLSFYSLLALLGVLGNYILSRENCLEMERGWLLHHHTEDCLSETTLKYCKSESKLQLC